MYVPEEISNKAGIIANMLNFSNLADSEQGKMLPKVTFEEVEYLPPCVKYLRPESVEFVDNFISPDKMVSQIVSIESLVNMDKQHFLNLHPIRFDRVKSYICSGMIDMPVVRMDHGDPYVADGRHRIIGLYVYGFTDVEVLMKEEQKEEITSRIKAHKIKENSLKSDFIAREDRKEYSLLDFDFSRVKNV